MAKKDPPELVASFAAFEVEIFLYVRAAKTNKECWLQFGLKAEIRYTTLPRFPHCWPKGGGRISFHFYTLPSLYDPHPWKGIFMPFATGVFYPGSGALFGALKGPTSSIWQCMAFSDSFAFWGKASLHETQAKILSNAVFLQYLDTRLARHGQCLKSGNKVVSDFIGGADMTGRPGGVRWK